MAVDTFIAPTGTTQRVFLIDPITGGWWNTSGTPAYETFAGGNYSDYAITATEYGSTGVFWYTVPSTLPAGHHNAIAKTRAGGSVAQSDVVSSPGHIQWDGSAVVPLSSRLPTASYAAPDNATVAAIDAKTTNLPASPAATGDAMTLETGERDAVAAALLDLASGVETGLTPRQFMRVCASALAGVLAGAGTTTITIAAAGNPGTNRITATVDSSGNRSAVVLSL